MTKREFIHFYRYEIGMKEWYFFGLGVYLHDRGVACLAALCGAAEERGTGAIHGQVTRSVWRGSGRGVGDRHHAGWDKRWAR